MKTMFSKRLQELREEAGLSQKKLGERVSVSAASIGYYENGTRDPGLDIAVEFAKFFGVSLDYMAGISDHRAPTSADITARTGLSEIAVEVLEAKHALHSGTRWMYTDSEILSEILQTAVPPLTFDQYMTTLSKGTLAVHDESGETLGILSYIADDSGREITFYELHGEHMSPGVDIEDFDSAEILPLGFRLLMHENYEKYAALSRRCRGGSDILEILSSYYANADLGKAKLSYNRNSRMGVITGDVTENFIGRRSGEVRALYNLCNESRGDVTTLPIASLLDEVTLRELGDALRELRARHMQAKEAADAKEE